MPQYTDSIPVGGACNMAPKCNTLRSVSGWSAPNLALAMESLGWYPFPNLTWNHLEPQNSPMKRCFLMFFRSHFWVLSVIWVKLSEQDVDFLRLYSFASKEESEREREGDMRIFFESFAGLSAWWISPISPTSPWTSRRMICKMHMLHCNVCLPGQ